MLRVRQLEMLCAVVDLGTTSGAAESLGVSQPAVSNMIKHIEDQVGIPLFRREKGRLAPTPEALHITQEAQYLFAQQKRMDRIVKQLRGGSVGQLNVIATPSIGDVLLPGLVTQFMKERPQLRPSIELGSVDEVIQHLISGRSELGFSITPPRHPSLSVQPLAEGKMVCAVPKGHDLEHARTVTISDLNHVKHISYANSTPLGQMIDQAYSREGLERRFDCEVRHTSTALQMVAAGAGVALVDSFAVLDASRDDIVVRPVDSHLSVKLYGISSKLFPTSQMVGSFQQFIRESLMSPSEGDLKL